MKNCAHCRVEVSLRSPCTLDTYSDFADGVPRTRLPYPSDAWGRHCPDCSVPRGAYHHPGCLEEVCPKCWAPVHLKCNCPVVRFEIPA